MSFGHVFTMLCSTVVILCSSVTYAQVDIPSNLNLQTTKAKAAYKDYIVKFDECHDKKLRKNNPYPINQWLISLSREKQISVIFYLHNLAEYNCVLNKQNTLINVLKKYGENVALEILKEEGWFNEPIYGYSYIKQRDQSEIALNEADKEALDSLIDHNFLPFNGIDMDQIIRKLNSKD